jgi:hypothetical protein
MVYSTAVSNPPIKKTWKPVAAGYWILFVVFIALF